MTDPIADMLTRIRNSFLVKKKDVVIPMSKIKYEIAKILERDKWVNKVELVKAIAGAKNKTAAFDSIKITLKYREDGKSYITLLKRISKPGLRVYVDKDHIPTVLNNLGIAILSTPQGLMTNREARRKNIGGELLCEIY
ncbi:MAG: 30S ribosomal protein S8 [Candidatus Falkowbacteria bacterium]